MFHFSVITGDLIGSTRVADTAAFRQCLDELLALLRSRFGALSATYRGDGFQIALDGAANPFQIAIILRAGLIAHSPEGERWDARVAIAFGEAAGKAGNAEESVGSSSELEQMDQNAPAFIESGRTLDSMRREHLKATANDELVDMALAVACAFADDIINQLTAVEAEVLYYYLLDSGSHQNIADRLGKQRPTVTLALQRARYKLIEQFVRDMDQLLRRSSES